MSAKNFLSRKQQGNKDFALETNAVCPIIIENGFDQERRKNISGKNEKEVPRKAIMGKRKL